MVILRPSISPRREPISPPVPRRVLVPRCAEISSELGISIPTVRKHLERIYERLGAHSRTEAAARARSADGTGSPDLS
jgi:Bacterial regulatory proteins, luxR family